MGSTARDLYFRLSSLVTLNTLILDDCHLEWVLLSMESELIFSNYSDSSLGFLGQIRTVTTLSLNKELLISCSHYKTRTIYWSQFYIQKKN